MIETIYRSYLEIKSIEDLIESNFHELHCSINLVKPDNFQINKFFHKSVGKKHRWKDRLAWSENEWIKYSSSPEVETYIMKVKDDLAGYYELNVGKMVFPSQLAEIEKNQNAGAFHFL